MSEINTLPLALPYYTKERVEFQLFIHLSSLISVILFSSIIVRSAIETGASKVALPTLIELSKVLNTTVDTLLYDVTPATANKFDRDAKVLLEDCSEAEREYLLELLKVAKEGLRKV